MVRPPSEGIRPSGTSERPTIAGIFTGFFMIGVRGFGGVLPWARRTIVEERQWLSASEFTEVLGLCQFLPGGNIINVSVAVGSRFRGGSGAVAALLGLMLAPVAIVIGLGAIYDQFAEQPIVRRAFAALAAMAIAAATFVAIAVIRLPLPLAMPVLAVVSILLLWWFEA
jgi:chromate transporter